MGAKDTTAQKVVDEVPVSRDELLDGPSYLDTLRDGRAVYIYGERVPDVTSTRPSVTPAGR